MRKIILILFIILGLVGISYAQTWDLLDEDCSDISDWADNDNNNGVSEVDPAGQFRMDANLAGVNNFAFRSRTDIDWSAKFILEIRLYHDDIGDRANNDHFSIQVQTNLNGGGYAYIDFSSTGLFISDGATYNEVGTDEVAETTWQVWRFEFDYTIPASATVDVYLDDGLVEADVDCSAAGAASDVLEINQKGYTTDNMLTHIDYIKVASDTYTGAQIFF